MGSSGSKSKSKAKPKSAANPIPPDYDFLFKVLLIGDSGVGKSCIILRFADNTFSEENITTIGADFKIRSLNIDAKTVKLQLWDTAGQERFRTITSSYYRGANVILFCYDISSKESFNNLAQWLGEADRYASENVMRVVVACKSDLSAQQIVREEDAKEFCDRLNLTHHTCSSRSGDGIESLFSFVATELKNKWSE